MKILIPNHFPLQGSGSGIFTMNVAKELVYAGHDVLVIVPDHAKVEDYPFPIRTMIFSDGENDAYDLDFNFPCFTTHPRSTTTFYELTDAQFKAYVDAWTSSIEQAVSCFHPDVIHAQHVWVTPYVAYKTGLPYVINCHGTDLIGFQEGGVRYRDMALAGAKNACSLIAISKQVKVDAAKTYQISDERIHIIGNGFDENCFRIIPDLSKESVLAEFDLSSPDKPLVSFAGKYTEIKGIDTLLKAASIYEKALPGVQTLLVGHGHLWEEMHALRDKLGLQGVYFLGHQDQPVVARVFNAADVSVVSSRFEAFGLVAIESMACGTPVVATRVGGLPDFIDDSVGALVPVDDVEAMANAIIDHIKDGAKTTKGLHANHYANENFTWKKQVGEMIDLYQEALVQQ